MPAAPHESPTSPPNEKALQSDCRDQESRAEFFLSASILSENLGLLLNDEAVKPWNRSKAAATAVEAVYETHGDKGSVIEKYAERIRDCSNFLQFALVPDDCGVIQAKFKRSFFCRVRFCPVCQWRRSLKWKAKFWQQLPAIESKFKNYRWLFLTVTVKNVPVRGLRNTVQGITKAFQRLTRLRAFPAKGWVRSVEVTRAKNGEAHPHIHALLLVPPGYFGGTGYMKTEKWAELWKQCARLDYDPVVDIRAVKYDKDNPETLATAVAEIMKYTVKEQDLTDNPEWSIDVAKELLKTRAIAVGGVLRGFLNKGKEDSEELDDSEPVESSDLFNVHYNRKAKRYEPKS